MKNQTDKQSKTKEELNALKKEVEAMNKKLAELNEEELAQVTCGLAPDFNSKPGLGLNCVVVGSILRFDELGVEESVFQGGSSKTQSPIE